MLKSWKIIVGLLRDNINIFWELRCLLNLSCADSTQGEEAGWMYWEAGEFVRKWCYTLLSGGEESCILSECQQCIVHTMKRRWGNYFLPRHKTSIRSLASSTHTQQYTLQSGHRYCILWCMKEGPMILDYQVTSFGSLNLCPGLPFPEKWHILKALHFWWKCVHFPFIHIKCSMCIYFAGSSCL